MPDEMEKGFKRLVNLRFERAGEVVEDTLRDLMKKSGYALSDLASHMEGVYKTIKAVKDGSELLLFIFPSIVFVPENLEALQAVTGEYAVAVPSENSPAPFVTFIRENMDRVRKNAKMMIWVVNPDQKTVNPFMSTPRDKAIWNNFSDPEKTLQATKNWMKGAVRSRVLDEDF